MVNEYVLHASHVHPWAQRTLKWVCMTKYGKCTCIWHLPSPSFSWRPGTQACQSICQNNTPLLWCQTEWLLWHTHYRETVQHRWYNFLHRLNFCSEQHSIPHDTLKIVNENKVMCWCDMDFEGSFKKKISYIPILNPWPASIVNALTTSSP